MVVNSLIDTNVFLEVLLSQEKQEKCKNYLLSNLHYSAISDFSVHSMGVILSKRLKRIEALEVFLRDVLPNLSVVSLPKEKYSDIPKHIKDTNLDFDDSYQYLTAKSYGLKLVTLDLDFRKVNDIEILFL